MPYIKDKRKPVFESGIMDIAKNIETIGEMNYVVTCLCHEYINKHGLSYDNLDALDGMLGCAGKELYRRVTGLYEDVKIVENGDVMRLNYDLKRKLIKPQ